MLDDFAIPTARDWTKASPFDLKPGDDLFDALERLAKHNAAAAPVIDDEGNLLGMLTEKDCLRVLSTVAYDGDMKEGNVGDFMSSVRVVVRPEMDLFGVAEQFLATNFPLLPVVEGEKLVGLISRQSMLNGILTLRERLFRGLARAEAEAGRQADRPRSIESMQRVFARAGNRDQLVRLVGRRR